jgi:hypothetical protein
LHTKVQIPHNDHNSTRHVATPEPGAVDAGIGKITSHREAALLSSGVAEIVVKPPAALRMSFFGL